MIIGLAEPGQGEKLGRNNKKKAAGGREREKQANRHRKLIKRQLVLVDGGVV